MFKSDLDKSIASITSLTQAQSREASNALFDIIKDTLAQGEDVSILGFGRFSSSVRKGRTLPKSIGGGGPVTMPDTRVPKFHAFDPLRRSVRDAEVDHGE